MKLRQVLAVIILLLSLSLPVPAGPLEDARAVIQEIYRDTRTEQITPSTRGRTWVKIRWIRPTSVPGDEECEVNFLNSNIEIGKYHYDAHSLFGPACEISLTQKIKGRSKNIFWWGEAEASCYPIFYIRESSYLVCIGIQSRLETLTKLLRSDSGSAKK
jgi:hypothetical protein